QEERSRVYRRRGQPCSYSDASIKWQNPEVSVNGKRSEQFGCAPYNLAEAAPMILREFFSTAKATNLKFSRCQAALNFKLAEVWKSFGPLNEFALRSMRTMAACCRFSPEFSPAFTSVCRPFSVMAIHSSAACPSVRTERFVTLTSKAAVSFGVPAAERS